MTLVHMRICFFYVPEANCWLEAFAKNPDFVFIYASLQNKFEELNNRWQW